MHIHTSCVCVCMYVLAAEVAQVLNYCWIAALLIRNIFKLLKTKVSYVEHYRHKKITISESDQKYITY